MSRECLTGLTYTIKLLQVQQEIQLSSVGFWDRCHGAEQLRNIQDVVLLETYVNKTRKCAFSLAAAAEIPA